MSATSIEVGPATGAPVLQFVQRLRRRHLQAAGLDGGLRALLALAPPAIVLAWLLTAWRGQLLGGLLLLVTGNALLAAVRSRSVAAAGLLRGAGSALGFDARQVAELGDELATWLELQGNPHAPSLLPWLTADVTARVPKLTQANLAPLGRRRLGGWLWLLPLGLLLLLAWFLVEWLSPPWSGLLGGGGGQVSAAGGGAGGSGGEGPGGASPNQPTELPESSKEPPTRPPPEPQPEPQPQPQPEPQPPAPLLELPAQQQFLLPDFLGDGPTRRARMQAAELETGSTPRTQQPQRVGEAPTTTPPLPPPETFQRAAEAALRDRHVPPAERPMVRRFFEALQRAAK